MWATGAYGYLTDYLLWWVIFGSLLAHAWCFFRLWPADRRARLRLFVGNLLVAACMLAFAGTLAESYLRFVSVATDAFGTTLTAKRWFMAYPELNSLLYRDVEWSEQKPSGVRRIAFVGDSFTYGWGINDPMDRFTEIIQARFDENESESVEVMNVAWVGWDSGEELRATRDLIHVYGVDEVVLCHLPNDIESLIPVSDSYDPKMPPKSQLFNTSSSFLLDYLYHRIIARRLPSVRGYCDWIWDGYSDPDVWRQHTRVLHEFVTMCHDDGVTFRVALVPLLRTNGQRFDGAHLHGRLRGFFEQNNVPVVDLLPVIENRDASKLVVNAHDAHPNEEANQLFADAIWHAFYVNTRR